MSEQIRLFQMAAGAEASGRWNPSLTTLVQRLAAEGRLQVVADPGADARAYLPWVAQLRGVFGLHETRDNAALRQWLRSDGSTLGNPDALPWCGDAMETAVKNALADEPFPGVLGANPYWARNWIYLGHDCGLAYGAIAVFARGEGGHVGVLVGQDPTHLYVLGGNQGDAVSVVRMDRRRLLGLRWPATGGAPGRDAPRMTPGGIPTSADEV